MQYMNNLKARTQEILEKVKEWDGIHKRQLVKFVNRILECTMLEHSHTEDYIRIRTNCSSIFTLRTLEWKNFLNRSLQNSNQFIMAITLENYQQKMIIDEQLLQFEYQEELNKWLETVKHSTNICKIFHRNKLPQCVMTTQIEIDLLVESFERNEKQRLNKINH